MKRIGKMIFSFSLLMALCMTNIHTIKAVEANNIVKNDETGLPDATLYAAALKAGDEQKGNKDGILSIEEMQAIRYLDIVVPKASNISLKGISKLTQLSSITMNSFYTDWLDRFYTIENLEELKEVKSLQDLSISHAANVNSINDVIGKDSQVSSLFVSDSNLHSIAGIENAKNLQYLYIGLNYDSIDLYELDASQLLACKDTLISLDIRGWKIKNAEKLGELQKLDFLGMSETKLANYNFISKLKLSGLEISGNGITDISFLSNQTNLNSLDIQNNKISDISSLKELVNLSHLSGAVNAISDLSPLEKCNLENLHLSNNKISDISPLKNMKLEYLYLYDNQITNITAIKDMPFITLDLGRNKITDISVLAGKNMERVSLEYNQITDISALHGAKIGVLHLQGNQITDLTPLTDSASLEALDVSYNKLSTLPDLTKLVNLKALYTYFYGNELTAEELKAKLPSQLAKNSTWIKKNAANHDETVTPEPTPKPNPTPDTDDKSENAGTDVSKPVVPGPDTDDKSDNTETDVSKPTITVPTVEQIVSRAIPEDLADRIYGEGPDTVKVVLPTPDTVIGEVFKAAKETGKDIEFDITDKNGDTQYGWKFNSNDIKNPNMDIDLSITFETEKQKEIEKLTNQSNMLYVSFAHHGPLPGKATITLKVDSKYKNGDIVYLYYYNEEKGTIERKGEGFAVKDGYAEFTIDHCSVYYLSTDVYDASKKPNKVPVTGDTTDIMTYTIGGLSALVLLTVMKRKNKVQG